MASHSHYTKEGWQVGSTYVIVFPPDDQLGISLWVCVHVRGGQKP